MSNKQQESKLLRSLNDPEHTVMNPGIHYGLWLSALTVIIFVIWASFAEIDEVVRGEGRIVPSSRLQMIQSLEGGIVDKLMVNEGDMVDVGQVLVSLDNTRFYAAYMEGLSQSDALTAAVARLESEVKEESTIKFPEGFDVDSAEAKSEMALFNARRDRKQQTLASLKQEMAIANKQLKVLKPLVERRAVSQMEMLRLDQTVQELKGRIVETQNSYMQDAYTELSEKKGMLNALNQTLLQKEDQLNRTKILSPVKGQVNDILITTRGGVIQPGEPIMKVLPLEDRLLVETKIKPQDVAFLAPGMKARVKITAYDYTIYGDLEGVVEQISPDTFEEDTAKGKEYYYQVLVHTKKNYLERHGEKLPIRPGMITQVDVLGGKRTIMSYMLKPLIKAKLY
ncbi:HlyD family efflux transporter periplasmic adaptor subunit [Psychromonas aquatilis]|uniref:HlyD family efflux transporter periplasmic adaptor subunit n=1 Tax=Psychromonas aquatilis TaxID=2005072 RepID=A0ABU9GU68_9GAMM